MSCVDGHLGFSEAHLVVEIEPTGKETSRSRRQATLQKVKERQSRTHFQNESEIDTLVVVLPTSSYSMGSQPSS
jgi:hypothetical protein